MELGLLTCHRCRRAAITTLQSNVIFCVGKTLKCDHYHSILCECAPVVVDVVPQLFAITTVAAAATP